MPPKVTIGPDEDVKFLLTVIRQMSGTIDWQKVTNELSLPSKGAAAKRYSRMPTKYHIAMPDKASSATQDVEDAPKTPKKAKGKATPKKQTASAKKRKIQEAGEAGETEDEENEVNAEMDNE